MPNKKTSIYKSTVRTYLAATLIPFLLVSSLLAGVFGYSIERQTTDKLKAVSGQAAKELDGVLHRLESAIELLTKSEECTQGLFNPELSAYNQYDYVVNTLKTRIDDSLYIHPEVKRIFFLTDNPCFVGTRTIERLEDIPSDAWRTRYGDGYDIHWMHEALPTSYGVQTRRQAQEQIGLFAVARIYPVRGKSTYEAYLVLRADEQALFSCLTIPDVSVCLTDERGELLFENGERRKFDYQTEVNGWKMTVSTDSVIDNLWILLILSYLFLLLSLGVTYAFLRRFGVSLCRRLQNLSIGVTQVAQGRIDYEIAPDTRGDELSEIVSGFQQMQISLKELIERSVHTERLHKESEIKALQAQINPHFLYNLFSMVHSMAITSENESIASVVMEIAAFYRALYRRGSIYISIGEELENMRRYIRLQKLLHNDRFDVSFHCEEEVKELQTVNMLLQPLIENAIEHGVLLIRERGKIEVTAAARGRCVEISVTDNGPGFEGSFEEALSKSQSYGLVNVCRRCEYLFGEGYGVSLRKSGCRETCLVLSIPSISAELKNTKQI